MWTVLREPPDSPDAVALLRDYFAELTVRYFHRETSEQEIDETLEEFPSTGLALFLVLRADEGVPAGCLGLHATGEITRVYVVPRLRRAGGARALLAGAESWARAQGLTRLFPRHAHRPRRGPRVLCVVRLRRARPGHEHSRPVPGPLVREGPHRGVGA